LFLFNKPFSEAHNATADVEATTRCFLELIRRKLFTAKELRVEPDYFETFKEINPQPFDLIGLKHINLKPLKFIMAIKKGKKKVKKKKSKEKKEDDDEEKPIIDIPEYKDPDIYTPKATLKICLATPITQKLTFTVEVMISARVEEIRQMIIDNHDGAIQDVTICLGSFEKSNELDPKKTLAEQGVVAEGD